MGSFRRRTRSRSLPLRLAGTLWYRRRWVRRPPAIQARDAEVAVRPVPRPSRSNQCAGTTSARRSSSAGTDDEDRRASTTNPRVSRAGRAAPIQCRDARPQWGYDEPRGDSGPDRDCRDGRDRIAPPAAASPAWNETLASRTYTLCKRSRAEDCGRDSIQIGPCSTDAGVGILRHAPTPTTSLGWL